MPRMLGPDLRKWQGKAPIILETISTPADIITIPDGADGLPMALTVGIEPVQDLHGYDNPWPAGGGKNKCYDPASTLFPRENGCIVNAETRTAYAKVKPNTDYIFSLTGSNDRNVAFGLSEEPDVGVIAHQISNTPLGNGAYSLNSGEYTYIAFYYGSVVCTNIMIEEGSTKTDFAPYSNICPISGWTGAKVTRTGKNLVDISRFATEYPDYCSFVNGVLSVTSYTSLYNTGISVDIPAGAILNWSITNGTSTGARCRFAFEDGTATGVTSQIPYTAPKRITSIRFDWTSQGTFTVSDFQAEIGSTATAYEPYTGVQYDITFPQAAGTVYGGTLTVNQDGSGELVVDMANVDLGSLSYSYVTAQSYMQTQSVLADAKAPSSNSVIVNAICQTLPVVSAFNVYSGNTGVAITDNKLIRIKYTGMTTDPVSFKTAISGVHFVYELATPATYSLTPGQVKTLLGVNNIFADCGPVLEITAPRDTKLYIDVRIAELQALILENIGG